MEFNNREISIIIWTAVAIIAMCFLRDIRSNLLEIFKAFFSRHFLGFFSLAFLWMTVCVYGLYRVDLWEYANLKTTIVWGATFAFSSMFSLSKIRSDRSFFSGLVSGAVKPTAIVVFVTSLYSFSLWVEILLVPLVVFLSLLSAVSSREEKNAMLTKFLDRLVIVIGVAYLTNAAFEMVNDFTSFASGTNFKDFFGPVILTFMFFPFLYLFGLYGAYDVAFAQIGLRLKDEKIAAYAKRTALMMFRTDVELMQQWLLELYNWAASGPAEIKASIVSMKYRRRREKKPLPVASADGWVPRDARRFLYGFRLEIDTYRPAYGYENWFGNSKYVEVGANFRSSNISYYIRGGEDVVRHVKLVLNVNSEEDIAIAEDSFREIAESLLRVVFDCVPSSLEAPLNEAENMRCVVGGRGVQFCKEMYVRGAPGGYTRSIGIYNDDVFCDEGD
ncbi:hypothetical protein HX819_20775 [Pseudomonas sp. D6002]|jgi:hypothetical protein|uniref:hypothetical protein n=1 Tax=unclassified Pseudomonas TaxID=196821 RepID=UPI0015A42096|nr:MULTISPECIES: hypothetical protein [unclassified Pseudomonas]NVZ96752.1 hypothetical protein [Pseudomonas sp. B6001]NWB16871.1 hypothetical protein [Pseudomonas sp. D6002]